MAELARKASGKAVVYPRGDSPGQGGFRCAMVEVTTGGAETTGTVTMTNDFGTIGPSGTSGLLTFLASPVGVSIQQDTGTVVANASVTTAGVVTTGTIVASKNYWVFAFCV